ncbi:MAG: UDP-3-O-(3-hydroxymyristoyl)glucosamine N-acyltransferase [Armatimonadota bacterium]|nr:UDP-3-O-(3-hydroxymyristoyl)glucosamine N-acyltransferase [Armatimonadota bacterium]
MASRTSSAPARGQTTQTLPVQDRAAEHVASVTTTLHMTIGDIARLLDAELVGDAQTLITGVASLDNAAPGMISFIEHEGLLNTALTSSAAALIAPSTMAEEMRHVEQKVGKPAVLTGNPRLAFARVMEYLQPTARPEPGIDPTAIVEPDAHIGEGVTIREFCYVGHHAHIGDGVILYPHVYVGDGAQICAGTILYPSVVIGHHVQVGERVRIHSGSVLGCDGFGYVLDERGQHHKVPQVGTVIIEDDVEIGANVCIDRATMGATRIGAGTKIDNLVQIAHNVQVGRNCILCGQVGLSGSVVVEDSAILAGQVGARDHVKIGKGVIVGAKGGVMNDIPDGEFVVGLPALPNRQRMKLEAAFRRMPDTQREVRDLEKQVKALQEQLDALKEAKG